MARHDYDLPADWETMTDHERQRWLTTERCRTQAMRQETPTARRIDRATDRARRRAALQTGIVDVEDWR